MSRAKRASRIAGYGGSSQRISARILRNYWQSRSICLDHSAASDVMTVRIPTQSPNQAPVSHPGFIAALTDAIIGAFYRAVMGK